MKKSIIFFVCSILLSCVISCVYLKHTHMNNDDLRWLKSYNKGDTVLFHSNEDNIDTLIITNINIHNSLWPFVENEASTEYIANGSYEYQLHHKGNTFDGILLLIKKEYENEPVILSFSFGGLYSDRIQFETTALSENGEIIDDCIIINKENSHEGKYQKLIGIKDFIWSRSQGLLEFSTKDMVYKRYRQ